MTDERRDVEGREPEPSLPDIIDIVTRRAMTALVVAGALVSLAIYSRPGPPRYQAFAAEGQVIRLDTRKGTIIGCDAQHCTLIVKPGQRLDRRSGGPALPRPGLPALPGQR